MIEELKALAEKATPGPWMAAAKPSSVVGLPIVGPMGRSIANVSDFATPGTPYNEDQAEAEAKYHAENQANAALIVALVNNLPAIISALEAVPVMKEALERIALNDDLLEAQITATAALAALEGK